MLINRNGVSLLVVLLFGVIQFDTQDANAVDVHPVDSTCADCHLAGDATTVENAYELIGGQAALCGGCHEDALAVAHPSDFSPGRPMPEEYPVDWKGDVTCSTCHEVHGSTPGLIRGEKRGRELCLSCHELSFFTQMADTGLSIQQVGHLKISSEALLVPVDDYSMHCLSCHSDGAGGFLVDVDMSGNVRHNGSARVAHPIGVDYNLAMARGIERRSQFHPPAALNSKILLPNGMVSCVSCHEGYSDKHGQLVMSNAGSKLCLECHDR
ncbi:MAG: cytochrome c3 family protein [Candidatus Polarisedimenticolaceae bacterium]|nr:cytochrome c3 family protein [Candidatus Polarisedimenticolaceae bacterium]